MRAACIVLLLAACSQPQNAPFAPYCVTLSTKPSTWTMSPTGCSFDAGFDMRFDQTTPQPCGAGCTCAVGTWLYGSAEEDQEFTVVLHEWCQTPLNCTVGGAQLDGGVVVYSTGPPGIALLGNGCSLTATPH